MTRDLFSRLYRWRHCRRVPHTVADLPDPNLRPAVITVRDALGSGDVHAAEHHFLSLLTLPGAKQEREITLQTAELVTLLERWHGRNTLTLLHEWALHYPTSAWPRILEIIYWRQRWMGLRENPSDEPLLQAQWGDLSIVTELIYRQSMALLGQTMLDWLVAGQLLLIESAIETPLWVVSWCATGSLGEPPEHRHLLEEASPVLLPLGLAEAWWPDLPDAPCALFADGLAKNNELLLGSRGFQVAIKTAPYGLAPLMDMARVHAEAPSLHEPLITLARQRGLSDIDVNAVESLFRMAPFYEKAREDGDSAEVVAMGERYERTLALSEESRSGLALTLFDWWRFQDDTTRNLLKRYRIHWQRYRRAEALLARDAATLTMQKLHRLMPAWLACGREAVWFRPLVEAQRHSDPFAAVLYGALCDNGWAGVQQNHDTAEAWYRYAVALAPPGGVRHFACASCMEEPFSQVLLRLSKDGDAPELWNLLCFAADAGYSDAQYRRGLFMSVNPDRFPLDESESWVYRSLRKDQKDTFVAHYHLALLYDDRIDRVDAERMPGTTAQSRAVEAMEHYLAFLTLFLECADELWRDEDLSQMERAMIYGVLCLCGTPEIAPTYLQAFHRVLIRFREELHQTSALAALALLYGRDDSPMYQYPNAVRIIESLRQLRDDNDTVIWVHQQLLLQNPKAFARLADNIGRDDLPACHPITPRSSLNLF